MFEKIGRVGRDFFFFFLLHFFFYDYRLYLDFAHNAHKILPSLFDFP